MSKQIAESVQKQLLDAALQFANTQNQPTAQGGGGGVETRYRGASKMLRSMVSWIPGLRSAAADLPLNERETLIARSRDASRNHLVARAAIMRLRTSVVGTGLVCYAQVDSAALGITPEQGCALNKQLDRIWELYALDPRECDAEATLNHYQLQALTLVSTLVNGDVFVATPFTERTGTIFGTRLQLIEADRVCNPNEQPDTENLVDGIEFDRFGAPIRYHVASSYKRERAFSQVTRKWQALEAFGSETGRRRTLHIMCDKERPGQKRGAPYLAPVLEPLQKLERYSSAELMAAVLSAFFTVFIEKGEGYVDSSYPMAMMDSEDPSDNDSDTIALGEGAIVDLAVGEKANVANPARPNAQFDPFFVSVVKQIGAALEIPMEELLLHYDSSYSAARAAMLQAWRYYSVRRYWLVSDFCQPSRALIIDEAVARGMIDLPGYSDPAKRRAYLNALWIGPARGAIDELKEANAAGKRIDIGVSNESMEAAAMSGEPWADIYAQRLIEINRRKADGIYTVPKNQVPVNQGEDDERL
ncbi:phage portal protein [Thiopseudomonas alkaliphila]|uniref:Phage portal protein n=1 Tax=Thiopseudomonas alkaliphila TaxID=1697053 RepID=A0AAW7DSV6_9GAMM|nr:phage portal protein [Thiopseudomonas alkaliphila]MDM1697100.1 phage portal protein [Thiopseudomonas alkaliphila]